MHYFQFNIGDYKSHTSHLSPIEDIIYRRLLDMYYLNEQPHPTDYKIVARKIGMPDNFPGVEVILTEFFTLTDTGWINKRADKEIAVYQGFIDAGKRGAAKRWGQGSDSPPNSPPTQGLIPNTNHEPLTTNQETINKKQETKNNGKSKTLSASALLAALDIPENLALDWIALRKSKKAAITQTALDGIQREAGLAGLSLEAALRVSCERGWAGFKSEWLADGKYTVQNKGGQSGGISDEVREAARVRLFGKTIQGEVIDNGSI